MSTMTKAQQQEIAKLQAQIKKDMDCCKILDTVAHNGINSIRALNNYMSVYKQDPAIRQLRDDMQTLFNHTHNLGKEKDKRIADIEKCQKRLMELGVN